MSTEEILARQVYSKFYYLREKNENVSCPSCFSTMNLVEFSKHAAKEHQIDTDNECCYCMGKYKWEPGKGTKQLNVITHRLHCLKQFLKPSSEPPRKKIKLDNVCIACYNSLRNGFTQSMDEHVKNPEWKHFYEPFYDESHFNLDHGAEHVKFTEESGLGSIIYDIFKKFNSNEYFFYHIMVRAKVYDKFLQLIDKTKVFGLPYQCLCVSGHGEDEFQHHKHMIIVLKKDYDAEFSNIWRKVKVGDGEKYKLKKRITTLHYLMNVIFYVSTPYATCDGSVRYIITTTKVGSHYWINRQLCDHAKIAIGCLYKEGHKDVIDDFNKAKSVEPFHQYAQKIQRIWHVEIQHVNAQPRNCIIPFKRPYQLFQPGYSTVPQVYIYGELMELVNDNKLLNMEFDEWYQFHLKNNNAFLDSILDKQYKLQLNQVKTMNQLVKVNKRWENKYDEKCFEYEKKINEYEKKINDLTQHYESEIKQLREKYTSQLEDQIKDFRNDIERLRNENERLRNNNEQQIAEHRNETNQLKAQHEAEINKLKAEHATEINQLKAEHAIEINKLKAKHTTEIIQLKAEIENGKLNCK